MFYAWDITVTANTTESQPQRKVLPISIGVVTQVSIKYARGCHGMVKVRLEHFKHQLAPESAGEWITGDNESVSWNEFFEIREVPPELVFLGCSPGTDWPHTVTVRVTVLPKTVASMVPVITLLTRLLKRMGVFR